MKVNDLYSKQNLGSITFIGTVVNNDSTSAGLPKSGMVQVRIPELYQGIPDTQLPWAIQINKSWFGSSSTEGSFSVPKVGSEVSVILLHGDPSFPAITGSPITEDSIPSDFLSDYPNIYGFVDDTGTKFLVNKNTGEAVFEHQSGVKITINNDAEILVENSTKINLLAPCNLGDESGGNIVTTHHVCAFTGANHPQGSTTQKAED